MKRECPLCEENPDRALEFFRNEAAIARLSDEWAVRGHSVVVCRSHVENVSDLGDEELEGFFRAYRFAERALLDVVGAERVVSVKLGLAAPHLHIHLYPISRSTTRADVIDIIERRVRDEPTPSERDRLVRKLRESAS